jgi:aspartate aminotransferase
MLFRGEIQESLTLKFAAAATERKRNNLPIISLGLGEPEFETPKEIIEATIKVLKKKNSGYSDSMGILPLRIKIAEKLKSENNINCSPDNIIVTAGAKQAYQLITMALLEPLDEIIVINPSFVSFIPQLLIAEPNCKIIEINVNKLDFSFPIDKIEKAITTKTKLVVINTPNNPSGYMIRGDELKKLFDLAVNNNFYILSDEIYEKLNFGDVSHISVGSYENIPTHVITINGFSKSHAMTGWRLGYACFPTFLKPKLLKIQQHMNTNTCTFIQEAMDTSFNIDKQYLIDYKEKLKARVDIYSQFLSKVKSVSGILPTGGFFAFMNIANLNMDSNTFCSKLIEEAGVATTPGIAFGKDWDDHIRISFATNDEKIKKGLYLIENFVKNSLQ